MIKKEQAVNLAQHTTFGINCIAEHLIRFSTISELKEVCSNLPTNFLVLGGGSNMLLTQDFKGTVLKNEIIGISKVLETESEIRLKVGAGVNWHSFVMYCIENNYGGVENLSLIPGNVGASPMQNIGAYGVEIKDVFVELTALLLETNTTQTFENSACNFGYRESIFKRALKNKAIICDVTFKLTKQNHTLKTHYGAIESELKEMNIINPSISDVSKAVIAIRESKLPNPKEIGNAGSFFKNPVVDIKLVEKLLHSHPEIPNYPVDDNNRKLAAGWLIEQAGWKGKTFDTFGVHKKQALVLVNYGGATGSEIFDLSTQIKEDVFSKFGVDLEREVNII